MGEISLFAVKMEDDAGKRMSETDEQFHLSNDPCAEAQLVKILSCPSVPHPGCLTWEKLEIGSDFVRDRRNKSELAVSKSCHRLVLRVEMRKQGIVVAYFVCLTVNMMSL